MGSNVDIDFDMLDLQKTLDGYGVRAKGFPMTDIAEILATAIDDEIELEGRGTWPDFKPSTLKRWPKRAGGSLLQKIGTLAGIQKETGPDWGQAGSPAPYAKYHVTGTKHMDARNFLDIGIDRVLNDLADIIASDIV